MRAGRRRQAMSDTWNWKPKDAAGAGLLYEPGNWGDILKAAWVAEILPRLRARAGAEFRYADPFAGMPSYPLTPGAKAQLEKIRGVAAAEVLRRFTEECGEWPSAARVAAALMGDEARSAVSVCDADPDRRAALAGCPAFTMMRAENVADGWELAARGAPGEGGLLLIDPYDLLKEWKERIEAVTGASKKTSVLAYIYNRGSQGPGRLRHYLAFRKALEERLAGRPAVIGRVAADARLPSAWHEMLFIPSPECAKRTEFGEMIEALERTTREIDAVIREGGAVEKINIG
jgi:hypothetical protein